jgi:CheY-like chemotaxis protein
VDMSTNVDEHARVDAVLEVERRSVFTTVIVVVIAALCILAEHAAHDGSNVFALAVAVLVPLALARFALLRAATRIAAGSPARMRRAFAPLLVQLVAWSLFVSWASVVAAGTGLATVLIATQCLCSAAVVLAYAPMPKLAAAIIVVTIVPVAVADVVFAGGLERACGLGAFVYCGMLVSYLPRTARERRSAVTSMLLLGERARVLEEARDVALAAAAAKEAFFANLSHEIRTPLHGLLGTVERLQATALDDDQRVGVDQVERCGRALLGTLNEALASMHLPAEPSGAVTPSPSPPAVSLAGRRVLVVDDNAVNLAVARAYLEALGIVVDVASGGHEALERAAASTYDAYLIDCRMPDKDGFDTTRDLRARGDDTPVLAITASAGHNTAALCRDAGMDELVEKPISSETLGAALARVIAAKAPAILR